MKKKKKKKKNTINNNNNRSENICKSTLSNKTSLFSNMYVWHGRAFAVFVNVVCL